MNLEAIFYFAAATAFETINPGPTLGLVVAMLVAFGRRSAFISVAGVAAANAVWVLLVFFLLSPEFIGANAEEIRSVSAGLLVFLASRRIISSMVELITMANLEDSGHSARSRPATAGQAFAAGFWVHAVNPVTPPYYVGAFYATTAGALEATIVCGVIAVLFDVIFYSVVVAGSSTVKFLWDRYVDLKPLPLVDALFRLLAGLFFLFLVAHVLSVTRLDSTITTTALTVGFMLLGVLAAIVAEAYQLVVARKGLCNKVLWRIVAMWGAWFSLATVLGAIFTLYQVLDNSTAMKLDPMTEQRVRICVIVAAFIATALAFAKSFGELQDEQVKTSIGTEISADCWQANPRKAGVVAFGVLLGVWILLWLTKFAVT